uniref:Uncharacterized protein n=1 Tax=Arthrobacter sp. J3.49 TaxID=347213 RepID=I3W1L0_9MICC|nr:hypothetical protein [Arthrobacter sp. J3.49]
MLSHFFKLDLECIANVRFSDIGEMSLSEVDCTDFRSPLHSLPQASRASDQYRWISRH